MAEPTNNPAPPAAPQPPQPPAPPADPKGKPPETPTPPQPPAVPDLDAVRKQAREDARKELEAEREKERKANEEKAAKEQGKFRELYDTEKAAAEAAKSEAAAARDDLARERAANQLRKYVAEKHADYIGCVDEFMVPLLKVDAKSKPEEVQAQAEAIAKRYVELNPRAAKGGGAPAAPQPGARLPANPNPTPNNGNGGRIKLSPVTRGF